MTLRVFVADDSVTIQKIVNLAFSGEDVQIEAVSDGTAALDRVKRFKPDVVLADIFMPGFNGYEVCQRIKEDPELSRTPVILMVGTFEPFDEVEAARVKSDKCLTKPFDTAELIQAVHALTEKKDIRETTSAGAPGKLSYSNTLGISPAAWDSFLGTTRILDIFDPETLPAAAETRNAPNPGKQKVLKTLDSEDTINLIVDRVVRKMSSEVIRDVAWEVVPELAESIIRSTIREQK